jgi:hypothetical protein
MATKGIGRPLTILLQADTTGFSKGLQQATGKLDDLSAKVNKAAKVASVALAGLGAVALDFAKAAAEDQKSSVLLAKTLEQLTGATDAQTAAVEDYITKTSLAVGIADDELRPAFARLVRSTDDVAKAQDLLNLALDISAATGKPLEAVSNALGRAYDGSTLALGKLGLGLDKATLKEGNLTKITEELDRKFGGFAETAAQTADGSFKRLTVATDELKESLGAGLLPGVTTLANKMVEFAPVIQRNSENIVKLGAGIAVLSAAIVTLKVVLTAAQISMAVFTAVAAASQLVMLTVAAAVGSASAAQTLAELTYKKSTAALIAYNIAMAAQRVATIAATVAQYGLNLAMSLNPIGVVIVAVAALGAAFVLAYKKIEPFRDLIDSIFKKLKDLTKTVKNSVFGKAITSAFDGFRAAGGPVTSGRQYIVGEAGPELFTAGTSGMISPAGSFGGGGGSNVNITINGAIDPEGVRRSLEKLFQNSARRTGAVSLVGATL